MGGRPADFMGIGVLNPPQPLTTTRLTDPDQLKAMGKLLDSLEDNDDVQNVWHSLENEEDLPE